MELESITNDWKPFLELEFRQTYFQSLQKQLAIEYKTTTVLPPKNQLLKAFEMCPLQNIKVVILGQDPYPTPGHAHGLCFSVESTVSPLPKSLQNIYKELYSDLGVEPATNGDLHRWAKQGVFLLNTVLSVRSGEPQSHAGIGWEKFTDKVIATINDLKTPVVFLLWGNKAQAKASMINQNKHFVLEAPHPSPLSAHRGFFGCKHFSKTNQLLNQSNLAPIVW